MVSHGQELHLGQESPPQDLLRGFAAAQLRQGRPCGGLITRRREAFGNFEIRSLISLDFKLAGFRPESKWIESSDSISPIHPGSEFTLSNLDTTFVWRSEKVLRAFDETWAGLDKMTRKKQRSISSFGLGAALGCARDASVPNEARPRVGFEAAATRSRQVFRVLDQLAPASRRPNRSSLLRGFAGSGEKVWGTVQEQADGTEPQHFVGVRSGLDVQPASCLQPLVSC